MTYAFSRPTSDQLARFKSFVDVKGPDCCWDWRGARIKFGYGHFTLGGKSVKSHRLAYEWLGGTPISGHHVLHRCDNPPCCNPGHLFLGTPLDNSRDMVSKGRAYGGSRHHRTRLSDADIATIFRLRASGETLEAIGRVVGCTFAHVRFVLAGRTRSQHMDRPPIFRLRALKLTDAQVLEANELRAAGAKWTELAAKYGVSETTVPAAIKHRLPRLVSGRS